VTTTYEELASLALEEALKRGADHVLVRVQERWYESITYDCGVLKSYSVGRVTGLGVKVLVSGGVGYVYTTSLNREGVLRSVEKALSIVRSLSTYTKVGYVSIKPVKDSFKVSVRVDPYDVDPEFKVGLVKEVNTSSMRKDGIKSVITRLAYEVDKRYIASSDGVSVESEVTLVGFSHTAVAKYGMVSERVSNSKTFVGGYEFIVSHDWLTFADEVDTLAIKVSQAKTPTPGTYVAVLDNEAVGLLVHEAFGHASEGDLVITGSSVLRGLVGGRVASELISIVDEGVVDCGYPVPYDDEGVSKGRTVVVNDGVLNEFLSSRYVGSRLGRGSTGNARVQDITYDSIVRQTNYYVIPRDLSVDELFEGVSYGIYIVGRGASGGEVDPSIGTYTFSIGPSYIIKNGEPTELVRGVVVSGNILETLMSVDAVAKDLKVITNVFGGCGKDGQTVRVGFGGPHIRVRKLVVGGL
jgi:TldD protein